MENDNLTDSPDGPSCTICEDKLNDTPYAIIDDSEEVAGRYHVHCLDEWIKKGKRGIFKEDTIKSYSIYHEDTFIEKVIINYPSKVVVSNNTTNPISETTVFFPEDENDSNESGREYPCYYQFDKCHVITAIILLILIIVFILFPYFLKDK